MKTIELMVLNNLLKALSDALLSEEIEKAELLTDCRNLMVEVTAVLQHSTE